MKVQGVTEVMMFHPYTRTLKISTTGSSVQLGETRFSIMINVRGAGKPYRYYIFSNRFPNIQEIIVASLKIAYKLI